MLPFANVWYNQHCTDTRFDVGTVAVPAIQRQYIVNTISAQSLPKTHGITSPTSLDSSVHLLTSKTVPCWYSSTACVSTVYIPNSTSHPTFTVVRTQLKPELPTYNCNHHRHSHVLIRVRVRVSSVSSKKSKSYPASSL